ncbi:MAG: hypothetical protein R3E01_36030 [Pirellulaceae bacterium]|nr:hypothetical protein [Planctomycetales bacterium]
MRHLTFEPLATRAVPAVFAGGTLSIALSDQNNNLDADGDAMFITTGNDILVLGVNANGQVTWSQAANNANPSVDFPGFGGGTFTVLANQVFEIFIDMHVSGNGNDDRVDLARVVNGVNKFPATLTSTTLFDGSNNSDNTFIGSPFDDEVDGADGNDTLYGNGGNDELHGDGGNDIIDGGMGNDRLEGGPGNDTLSGSYGDDDYEFDGGVLGTDIINEFAYGGNDTFDFTQFGNSINIDLTNNNAQVQGGGGNTVTIDMNVAANFENVAAATGAFNDTIVGNAANNVLQGRGGNDTITGGDGVDRIEGGDGNDTLRGGNGNDVINGGGGDEPLIDGEAGNDLIQGDGFTDHVVWQNMADPAGRSLTEVSGIVPGRKSTSVMWSIQDHGDAPVLYGNSFTSASGASRGYFNLVGNGFAVTNVDWEDMAYYKESATDYLYIADTGDNDLARGTYTIYRVAEPTIGSSDTFNGNRGNLTVNDRIQIQYDTAGGGVRKDSETMMVDPLTGDIYFVTKGGEVAGGNSKMYRLPKPSAAAWAAGTTFTLTAPVTLAFAANTPNDSPSSGEISPDGMQVLLKSDDTIHLYARTSTSTSISSLLGSWLPVQIPNAKDQDNREAIAWDRNNLAFYTASEDVGGTNRPLHRYDYGAGVDTLFGGSGADTIYGGNGADTIWGGTGNDALYGHALLALNAGGDGNDSIHGEDGDDFLSGGYGSDFLYGENGNDEMYGGEHDDVMYGGDGADALFGEWGNDTLYATNNAADSVAGDGDADTLVGAVGTDILYFKTGEDSGTS